MNVKTKLYASFTVIIALSVIMGIFGIFEIHSINQASTNLVNENIPRLSIISNIAKDQADHRRMQLAHVISNDAQQMASYENEINQLEKSVDDGIAKYAELTTQKEKVQEFQNDWNQYKNDSKKLVIASQQNDSNAAMEYASATKSAYEKASNDLRELKELNIKAAEQASADGDAQTSRIVMIYIVILLIMMIASIVIALKLSSYIAGMLNTMRQTADKLRDGDFRITPREITVNDEFGVMADSLIEMRDNVNRILKQILESAETVASSSEELTASSDQSAQVTQTIAQSISEVAAMNEKQSDAVNTTSAAIEEISASVEEIASNAHLASNHAEEASKVADNGGTSIHMAISQMESIEQVVTESAAVVNELGERSKEIGMIVETITGIAEQTNLLALNAAIEAARAGDQGRGFAVVAEEVRKLAAESQEAAEKISNLIGTIQSQTENAVQAMNAGTIEVQKGAEVVKESGTAFKRIIELNNDVAQQVKGIAQTTEEAAKASTDVISSVQNVDQAAKNVSDQTQTVSAATEEQSASMEEIASASRNLAEIAQKLNEDVNSFKV